MGGSGGGTSTNTVTQATPQIVPQSLPGYQAAQQFYQNVLAQPPTFPGQRLAPPSPLQLQGLNQAQQLFGQPSPVDVAAANQEFRTLQGGFLQGPEMQSAVSSAAQPLFQQFGQQVLPGIRDRAQFAGQGIDSTRRDVATGEAITNLGQALGTSVIAPLFQSERENQLAAVRAAPTITDAEIRRIAGLETTGQQQRQFAQEPLTLAQQVFEEPLFRQSQAAQALFAASGQGGGQGLSKTNASGTDPIFGDIATGVGAAASAVTAGVALSKLLSSGAAAGAAVAV